MNWNFFVTVIAYTVAIIVVLYALWMEWRDLTQSSSQAKQGLGYGASYAPGKVIQGDTLNIILNKIRLSALYDINGVQWRRCIIFSFVAVILLFLILFCRLPNGAQLLSAMLILYLLLYIMISGYQQFIASYAIKQIDESIALIRAMV